MSASKCSDSRQFLYSRPRGQRQVECLGKRTSRMIRSNRPHPSASRLSPLAPRPSRGLTLIEMLIGMAITLVMMAAVVNLFANLGGSVRNRRAAMEMSGQLRMARQRLFNDLAGATCPSLTWQKPENNVGYIEIVEGLWSDKNPSTLTDGIDNGLGSSNPELDYASSLVPSSNFPLATGRVTDGRALGDYDDILALTVRSESEPFTGKMPIWDTADEEWESVTIESRFAEVIWYAVENPADGSLGEPGMRTVYRRVLLIAPWVAKPNPQQPLQVLPAYINQTVNAFSGPVTVNAVLGDREYYRLSDISFRREGDLRIPNTLGDLTKRENRFAHQINGSTLFPHEVWIQNIRGAPMTNASPFHPFGAPYEPIGATPERQGEDVMLSDVLAFDVRVFDPGAPIFDASIAIVEPSDFGWDNVPGSPVPIGFGAYVDLYWDRFSRTWSKTASDPLRSFNGVPNSKSGLDFSTAAIASVTYDTWSFHYENDGINQDSAYGNDQGTNGLDDDVGSGKVNGVDDIGERETAPPYDVPLRAIQVKLRVYERDTRQIREATVTRNFVPQ